jgi:DNA-binding transcriptional MerR regulator
MLRYYEQIGLLPSHRVEGYAYRVYDKQSIERLQRIIVLRKLRIPLKQISKIFENPNIETILEVFIQNISEINDEITALTTMRLILDNFVDELRSKSDVSLSAMLFSDETMLGAINSLSLTKINFREEKPMEQLSKASEALSKLRNARIVQLPPFTVASYHFIGENPEETVGGVVSKFCKDVSLYAIKPDARMFGFNHPNPSKDKAHHGYEDWVTIPDDLVVPAPLVKKTFKGGLYAVHTITFGDFHEWGDLHNWVKNNEKYEPDYSSEGEENMHGCLEEHCNWIYANHLDWPENFIDGQLDLYLPVKLKKGR